LHEEGLRMPPQAFDELPDPLKENSKGHPNVGTEALVSICIG